MIRVHLDDADLKVMQDYVDALAEACETERYLIWDHPVYNVQSQPMETEQ